MYEKNIYSGIVSSGLIIDGMDFFELNIFKGGTAVNTTIGGSEEYSYGNMEILSGGKASGITISKGGELSVFSGGSAVNVNWIPTIGSLDIESGAYVTFASKYSGVYYGDGTQLLSHTATMKDVTLSGYGQGICVMSGGKVQTGEIYENGCLDVYSGGSADDIWIGSGGEMYVLSGGRASAIEVGSGGMLEATYSSYVTGVEAEEGAELEFTIASNTRFQGTMNGKRFDFTSSASNFTLVEGMDMEVQSGGRATKITVVEGSEINFGAGAYGSGIALEKGAAFQVCAASSTYVQGTICGSRFQITNGKVSAIDFSGIEAEFCIHSGGQAINLNFSGNSELSVDDGGYASKITIGDGGALDICYGGKVYDLTVSGNAFAFVEGYLNGAVVSSGGIMYIADGTVTGLKADSGAMIDFSINPYTTVSGTINGRNISLNKGVLSGYLLDGVNAYIAIQSGGKALDTTVSSGYMTVLSGGSAEKTTILSGGNLWLSSGAAANSTTINSGGYLWLESGATLKNTTLNSGVSLDAMSTRIEGVTVNYGGRLSFHEADSYASGIRENGGYVATNHNQNVVFVSNTVNSLNICNESATCHQPTTFNNARISQYGYLNLCGGRANNTVINSGGTMHVNDNSTASGTVINSGGNMFISSGTADSITLNRDGTLYIENGGVASNTLVKGGSLQMYDGKIVNTVLRQDSFLDIGSGKIENLDIGTWAAVNNSADWSGTLTIAGTLDNYGNGSGDIIFRINGNLSAMYMLNEYDEDSNYSISVSKYAGNGTYTLIYDAENWNENLTIYAGDQSYGTLKLDQTVTRGNRSYTLKLEENSLKLTIAGRNAAGYSSDINGDHFADLLMAHTKQGFAGAWKIGEDQKASWGDLSNLSGAWKIFAMGNTANDSFNDIYLYDEKANKIGAWVVGSGGKVTGWKDVAAVNANMDVLGLGDFDGDRISDLLLRSGTGDIGFLSAGKKWQYLKGVGEEWTIGAIGDFNGDGRDDLALAHDAGFAGCFLTNADGTVRWSNLDKLNGSEIAGAGDFNGDGVDDVLLKKGDFYGAWIVEEGNAKSWMSLGTLKAGNSVEQIADFNGDGVDDLRVRTASGDLGVLCVNGANSLEWHYYGSVGSEWDTSLAATM